MADDAVLSSNVGEADSSLWVTRTTRTRLVALLRTDAEIIQKSHEQLGYLGLKHYRLQDVVRNSKPNIRSNLDPDPGLLKPYNAHEI